MTTNSSPQTERSNAMGIPFMPFVDPKMASVMNERALKAGSKAIEVLTETAIALVSQQFDMISSTTQRMAEAGKALGSAKGPAELFAMPMELFRSNVEASVGDYNNFTDLTRQYASQVSALFGDLWANGAASYERPRTRGSKMAEGEALSKGAVLRAAE